MRNFSGILFKRKSSHDVSEEKRRFKDDELCRKFNLYLFHKSTLIPAANFCRINQQINNNRKIEFEIMLLVVVRHGQTIQNQRRIVQGHLPGRLSDLGKKQTEILGLKLQKLGNFDQIISSDLKRAADTALILSDLLEITNITFQSELRERCFGPLEGKSFYQLKRSLIEFGTTIKELKIPGCEDYLSFERRATDFFGKLMDSKSDRKIIVITHFGIIQLIINKFCDKTCNLINNCEGFIINIKANQTTIEVL